jgi:signal transduction histidine kinase
MSAKANILLVDDRPDKLFVLDTLLEPLGQNVIAVRSGEDALKELLSREFAVILLDVNMPGMDGLETAALIRGRKKTAHVPIIFITAFADELHTARGYELGAVDYILTPLVADVLRTKVRVFCDLWRMTQEIAHQAEERVALAKAEAERDAAEEHARKAAESDARKTEFLAMLGHELRNPMAAICNAAEFLKRIGASEGPAHEAGAIIDRQSRQLARLVDDLLDISRITRGKIDLRIAEFDLARAIESAVEANRAAIDSRHQLLALTMPDRPITMKGDFVRVVQIIANLVHNAAKFTGDSGTIELEVTPDANGATIRIKDSGVGIPRERLVEIFEPFTQLAQPAGTVRGGLGVGLTLARTLAELHGGTVSATSEGPDKGSEFVVRLPMESAWGPDSSARVRLVN